MIQSLDILTFSPRTLTYRFKAKKRRIDWVFSQYRGSLPSTVEDFVNLVNITYYKHSAHLYEERYIGDIERIYDHLLPTLRPAAPPIIIDIGAGTGFAFDQFQRLQIQWKSYLFLEPSEYMRQVFLDRISSKDKSRIDVRGGGIEDLNEDSLPDGPRIFVINSVFHHLIWLEPFLTALKVKMRPGDYFLLCHEPNNSYFLSPFMFLNYLLRGLVSDFALKKLGLRRQSDYKNRERWQMVNKELQERNITNRALSPLLIRRIIDYGVYSKGDWNLLKIPKEYNEGFWLPQDIVGYLGEEFKIVNLKHYRHLGDPGTNRIIQIGNRIFESLFPGSGGSTFSAVIQRTDPR